MQSILKLTTATAACFLTMSAVQAHHSYAQFDRTTDFSITGRITHVDWANPHVIFNVKTTEAETYTIEWQSLNLLQKSGIRKENLEVGDAIALTGSRNRDPKVLTITLIKELVLPAKNWRWAKNAPNR
jgi:hypothetical protein